MSRIRSLLPVAIAAALLATASIASAQNYSDPPDRVARLAYSSGQVEFAPAGENDWGNADINRPLSTGDRLYTGGDGRAALELGDAALRIDDNSAFNLLQLSDTTAQVELSQGSLNLHVRAINPGQTYEIDTPTVAFVADRPGTYRVDVAPDGSGAMVTVFDGAGTVYGQNGASRPVETGQSYRFNDMALQNVDVSGLPQPDDFDRFAQARDTRYTHSVSRQYVSPDTIGYDDLDQYGDWQPTPDYGQVWYPTHVAADWAPYRDGHWAWIDPYGWTWVDNEPWGFAPFHYGRWARVNDRWGWVPGQRVERAVYAPALVAFVGGSGLSISLGVGGGGGGYDNGGDYGQPVGWFPLGPRDVYVPPYRASRGYFNDVNITNIRTTYVNKTVINNYYSGYAADRPYAGPVQYAYRNDPRAFTVVPRNVFANARPIMPAVLHVKPGALTKVAISPIPHIAPTRASLAMRSPGHPVAAPAVEAFQRVVVARHAPPPQPVPFAAREKLIAKRGGAPLPIAQLHDLRQAHAKAQPQPERVKLVAAKPAASRPLPPMKRVQAMRPGKPPVVAAKGAPDTHAPPMASMPNGKPVPTMIHAPNGRLNPELPQEQAPGRGLQNPHSANAIKPIRAPINPPAGAPPPRPGELPSARFAHPQRAVQANAVDARRQAQEARAAQQAQGKAAAAVQAQQRAAQARADQAQAKQRADAVQQGASQARADQAQAKQRADAVQQRAAQARADQAQAKQRADAAQQRAAQSRADQAQAKQRADAAQQRQAQARAQQDQQRAAQAQLAQQRAEQTRAQQEQGQEQQRAQEAQQRAAQAQQAQQARAQQAQQRAEQARAQQEQGQEQQRAQEAQQRAAQAQQAQQARAQQAQQRAGQAQQVRQEPKAASAQRAAQEKKRKDQHDQQDNGH